MSAFNGISFRSAESTCGLAFVGRSATWISADNLGTIYQTEAEDDGKMNELSTLEEAAISCIAVSPSGQEALVARGNEVDLCSMPSIAVTHPMIARCTMGVSHAEYTNDGGHIFVASRSPDVIVYSKAMEKEESKISTSGSGVRSFSIHSSGEYMGFLDENRGLTIVRLLCDSGVLGKKYLGSNQEHKCGNLVHADTARKFDKFGFGMSWHPTDLCLAVPGDKKSIALFHKAAGASNGQAWEEEPLVFANLGNDLQHTDAVNIVRFSPNGMYLASADVSGTILIWDMIEKNPICKLTFFDRGAPSALFDLQWGKNVNDNYLIAVSANSCGKAVNVVSTADGRALPTAPVPVPVPVPAGGAKSPMPRKSPKKVVMSPPPASDVHDNEEKHRRIKKLGSSSKKEANDDNSDDDLFADAAGDFSIDAIKQQSMKAALADDEDDAADVKDTADDYADDADGFVTNQQFPYAGQAGGMYDPDVIPAYLHQPLEPSSTPFDEKRRRYMVWNLVGSIICREEDNGNRIEIKFADISGTNKNLNFVDTEDFKIAALSYEGAFFANQPEDPEIDDVTGLPIGDNMNTSDKKGSDIRYHAFSGQTQLQGANETFSLTLPVGEIVNCLAVGMGWAAVATSQNLLRIFSSTGIQLSITWLRGPVVCTIGSGSQLAVFYNDGGSLPDGSPNLAVEVFSISASSIRQEALLKAPVTPGGSLLQWAGFSNDKILFSMDTSGMLSALFRSGGSWQWIPLLDTAKASKKIDHKYWPICVKSSNLCYVLLNGESKPLVYPAPVVSTKPLNPPIVEVTDTRDNREWAEAENTRSRHLILESCTLNHLEDCAQTTADLDELAYIEEDLARNKAAMDKVLIRLFNEACRLQRTALSTDIALRIRTSAAVGIAIQIAQHFERPGLVRLLENILQQKQEDELVDQHMSSGGDAVIDRRHAMPMSSQKATTSVTPVTRSSQDGAPPQSNNYSSSQDTSEVEYTGGSAYEAMNDTGVSKLSTFKKKNVMSTSGMQGSRALAPPVNKFAQSNNVSSPTKKRAFAHEDLRNLKSSPSPKKPALLNRNTSFSAEARTKRLHDKNVI